MRELALLHAIGSIDDDLIAAASLPPYRAQNHSAHPLLAAAACLVLLLALFLPRSPAADGGTADAGAADGAGMTGDDAGATDEGDAGDAGCSFFSFTPVLWYGDRGYEWCDVTHQPADSENWTAVGEIAGIGTEEGAVLDNLWLCADFEARGTVYVSDEYPDMLYVRMTTDWLDETYVSFMVPPLSYQPMICFEGRLYCPAAHSNPDIKAASTLPEGFVNAGIVTKSTFGKVPDENEETTGWYNGCTIFADPNDKTLIYLGAYRNGPDGTEYIYAPVPLLTRELAGELTIPKELTPEN